MRTKMTLSVLFLTAMSATPTLANYFHNPYTNLNFNIGSAPSPTPRDIRENRLPQVIHAAPSGGNVAAGDMAKNADKPAANYRPSAQGEEQRDVSVTQLSR